MEELEVNEGYWWEKIDEYIMQEIKEKLTETSEYFGCLQILFIDQIDFEELNDSRLRFNTMIPFDEVKTLEKWIGRDEVKKWTNGYKNLDKLEEMHDTAIYVSMEESYVYATHFTVNKKELFDNLKAECEECYEEITFSESKQIDEMDEWIRVCKQCQ